MAAAPSLQQILRLINDPALVSVNDLAANIPPGRQGNGINYIYEILCLLAQATFTNKLPTIVNRVFVTKNTNDPFGGSVQAAIDSISGESATNPYIVQILSPGTYNENVTLREHIYLAAMVPRDTLTTIISASSGNTITMPDVNSGF